MLLVLVGLLALAWGLFRSPVDDAPSPLAAPPAEGSDWDPRARLTRAWRGLLGRTEEDPLDDPGLQLGRRRGPEAFGAVEGSLVLAPDDRPCRRAFVLLARVGRAPRETVTDETGAFHFGRVSAGRWLVRARDAKGRVVARLLLVQSGRTTRLGRLRIASRGSVEVRVTGPDGAVVPGATVSLAAPRASLQDLLDGTRSPLDPPVAAEDSVADSEGVTDGRGRIRFAELDPGPALLDVHAAGFVPAWRSLLVTEDGGTSRVVEVALARGRTIQGVIVDPKGRAVHGAWISVYDPDDLPRSIETRWFEPTDGSGTFEVTVPSAATQVQALVGAPKRPLQEFRLPVAENPLRIVLGAPATLNVDVSCQGTDEPAGSVEITAFGGRGSTLRLGQSQDVWMAVAHTGMDGRACLPVRPGRLHMVSIAYAPGGTESWLPTSKRQPPGRVCSFEGVPEGKLVAGENRLRIRVPAPVPPARMVGWVTGDDQPLVGVKLYVEGEVGLDPRTGEPSVTDEVGGYVVEVPRGGFIDYAAVLPGWVMAYPGQVEIRKDDEEVAEDIEMEPASAVTGRVVDEGGRGVPGVRVRISAEYDDPTCERPDLAGPSYSVTAADGSYVLDGLGSVHRAYVVATGDGYVTSRSKGFRLRAGETVRAPHLVLRTSMPLRVRVLDPAGRPESRALVHAWTLEEDERDLGRAPGLYLMQRAIPELFGPRRAKAHTDEDGLAVLASLPPGRVALVATASGLAGTKRELTHPLRRPGDRVHVLTLHAAYAFDGVVVDEKGAPVPGARVRLRRPGGAKSGAGEGDLHWPLDYTYTDDAGHFTFEDVPHIPVEIQIQAEGYRGFLTPAPAGSDTVRLVLVRGDPALVERLAEVREEIPRVAGLHQEAMEDETDEDGSREAALGERLEALRAEKARLREALGLDR